MKITVIGAGAIGGVIGAYLARGGCDVMLLDVVAEHVRIMQEKGLKIITPESETVIPVQADTVEHFLATSKEKLECVLLCVKAQFTTSALEPFLPLMDENTIVISVQNGLCEYEIAKLIGAHRTLCGFVNIFADYMEPGVVNYGGKGALAIGELDGSITPRLKNLEQVLVGLDRLEISDNVLGYLWGKLGYANILTATALTNETMADVFANHKYREMIMDLAAEVLAVADKEQIKLIPFDDWNPADAYPREQRNLEQMHRQLDIHVQRLLTYTKVHSGIWRDLAVRHRKAEMRAQLMPVIAIAEKHNLKLPLTELNLDLLDEIQDGKRDFSVANLDILLEADQKYYK